LKIKKLEELKAYEHRADVVLLDVPCSGLGVLRRNADTKWKLKETDLDALLVAQTAILQEHALLPRVGGALVYATCSILAEESELQVAAFLQKNKNYTLESAVRIHPHRDNCDGFYMARLIRKL
jgi:16S rRNA (cytosine967-C5)-methyltransferase